VKRDDDYLRQLLIEFEQQPDWRILVASQLKQTEDETKREYHVHLLCDACLLVQVARSMYRMTSQGHDYLDAVRDVGIWQKTKKVVVDTGGNATLEIVKALALGFLKQKIEKHTGVTL